VDFLEGKTEDESIRLSENQENRELVNWLNGMGIIVRRNDFISVAAGGKKENPANPSFVGTTGGQRVAKRRTLP
jgi:hypothetical protein